MNERAPNCSWASGRQSDARLRGAILKAKVEADLAVIRERQAPFWVGVAWRGVGHRPASVEFGGRDAVGRASSLVPSDRQQVVPAQAGRPVQSTAPGFRDDRDSEGSRRG
jgi:hypothetical protein